MPCKEALHEHLRPFEPRGRACRPERRDAARDQRVDEPEREGQLRSDDDEIACVHPGGPRMVGPGAIRAAFEAIFANGPIDVHPDKVRRMNTHDCAVHHVLERVQVISDEGPQMAFAIVTNVYIKTPQGWRMVLHHASPGMTREMQEISEAPSTLH